LAAFLQDGIGVVLDIDDEGGSTMSDWHDCQEMVKGREVAVDDSERVRLRISLTMGSDVFAGDKLGRCGVPKEVD
jgi:hypothetical protein